MNTNGTAAQALVGGRFINDDRSAAGGTLVSVAGTTAGTAAVSVARAATASSAVAGSTLVSASGRTKNQPATAKIMIAAIPTAACTGFIIWLLRVLLWTLAK